ncbi:hypothetical protein ALQ18_01391 [Pseudomonas marginalis pv. marginalis]|nr:hypothetical protein ALQ18_01391 [Pseudomonas marginalis pv. marginalis]
MHEKNFLLAKHVLFQNFKKGGLIGLGSRQQKISDPDDWRKLLELCDEATSPRPLAEMQKTSLDNNCSELLSLLLENHFIVPYYDSVQEGRYSRSELYYQSVGASPSSTNRNLANAAVSIIGCGGIGNHISAALVTSGVGEIHLVDADTVELSNLTRQILFEEVDVGAKKTSALSKSLSARNATCKIVEIDMFIDEHSNLDKLSARDLFVISADSPASLLSTINTYCIKNTIPFISVGYLNDISTYGPLVIPGKSGCIMCGALRMGLGADTSSTTAALNEKIARLNSRFKSATFPPVNAAGAALATSDIIKFLGKIGTYESLPSFNQRVGLHDQTLKVEIQDFSQNAECTACRPLYF